MSAETNQADSRHCCTSGRRNGKRRYGQSIPYQRRLRPIHAIQSHDVNWGEPTMSTETCEPWYVDATKGGKQTHCRQSDGPIVPMKV